MLASLIHASLANVIISSLFGIFVWLRGPRQPVQRLWMCFCLLVGVCTNRAQGACLTIRLLKMLA